MKNKGAMQLEYIAVVVSVALVSFFGLTAFGGQIKDTWTAVGNILSNNNNVSRPPVSEGGGTTIPDTEPEPVSPLVCDWNPFGENAVRMVMIGSGDRDGDGDISIGDTVFFTIGGTPMKISSSTVDMFRIVDIFDNKITFMALDSAGNSKYNTANNLVIFNNGQGQQYEGSTVETLITETYYNKLPDALKNILLKQSVNQTSWSLGIADETAEVNSWYKSNFTAATTSGTNYSQKKIGYRDAGEAYITIPDVEDIISWTHGDLTPQKIQQLFYDKDSYQSSSYSVWLRSVSADTAEALYYDVNTGKIGNYTITNTRQVRPMFVIDGLALNEYFE